MTNLGDESLPFIDGLRADLMGAEPARRRASSVVGIVSIGVALVVLVGGVVLATRFLEPTRASGTVSVQRAGSTITVRLQGRTTSNAVRQAFVQAGAPVRVTTVAVGPSQVGTIVGVRLKHERERTSRDFADVIIRYRVTTDVGDDYVVVLGRRAQPGESYQRGVDAFAKGEPMAGSCLQGAPVSQAAVWATRNGLSSSWLGKGTKTTVVPTNGFVESAVATSANSLTIKLSATRPSKRAPCHAR